MVEVHRSERECRSQQHRVILVLGIYIPFMGKYFGHASRLADALFNKATQRIFALVFGQPDREFGSSQLISLVGMGTGAVHRQLQRLTAAGLLTVREIGNQKFYRANSNSPLYGELKAITSKTVGVAALLCTALAPIATQIDVAFIFGSIARGNDYSRSDVDLMILSDSVDYGTVYDALLPVEKLLDRRISPMLLSKANWSHRVGEAGSFVSKVAATPLVFLIGDESDIA